MIKDLRENRKYLVPNISKFQLDSASKNEYNSFSEQISFRVHALGHLLYLSKQQPLRGPFTTKSMIFRQQQQKVVDNKKFSREFHRPERVRVRG